MGRLHHPPPPLDRPAAVVVSGITFLIFYVLPSADPARCGPAAEPSPRSSQAIRETFGLDRPLYVQYWTTWRTSSSTSTSARFYSNDVDVRSQLFDRLPEHALPGRRRRRSSGSPIGLPVGMISAVKRGSFLDRFAMSAALVAISAPVYWLGLVALYLFSNDIGQFPLLPGSGAFQQATPTSSRRLEALILPWIVLATAFAAIYARLLRANLLEMLGEDYIRTARAKGLTERRVIFRHGVRSAITPIVTVLGLDIGILVGGAILTETVFNIPGIGRLTYDAIQRGDLVDDPGHDALPRARGRAS